MAPAGRLSRTYLYEKSLAGFYIIILDIRAILPVYSNIPVYLSRESYFKEGVGRTLGLPQLNSSKPYERR